MSRLILYIAIFAIIYYLYRSLRRPENPQRPLMFSQDTVRCEHCGLHLPVDEAVGDGSHYYCSEEHRKLAQSQRR